MCARCLPPHPEGSDGCSGGVSWFWRKIIGTPPGWEPCCDKHDLDYGMGGDKEDRALADARLRECMRGYGYPIRAWIYWCAVRVFGSKHFVWRQYGEA